MSESTSEGSGSQDDTDEIGISDDQLPDDLQPKDDNPLAKPPGEDEGDEDSGMSLGPEGPQA